MLITPLQPHVGAQEQKPKWLVFIKSNAKWFSSEGRRGPRVLELCLKNVQMFQAPHPKRNSCKSLTRPPHNSLSRSASAIHLSKGLQSMCELFKNSRWIVSVKIQFICPKGCRTVCFWIPKMCSCWASKDFVNTLRFVWHLWIYMIDEQDIGGRWVFFQSEGRSDGLRRVEVK